MGCTIGIYLLTRDGDNDKAAARLKDLLQAALKQEPHNPAMWLRLSQPYTRLAGMALTSHMYKKCTEHLPLSLGHRLDAPAYQGLLYIHSRGTYQTGV